jgi:hypothetical protein
MYENRTMKPVEMVVRSGEGVRGRMVEGVNLAKIYCNIYRYPNCSTIIC